MENETLGPDQQERYRRAKARVASLRGFYIHLLTYLLVNVGLIAINLVTQPGYWWWLWATVGWGIGVAAHAAAVLVFPNFMGRDWEERKIRELISKDELR